MAYAVKYILQFTSDRGNEVRIEVLKKDYQGEVIYKSLGGSPSLSIEQGDGAIKGSSLVFAMQADIEGELQELYTIDNKQFKVNMYRNEVLSWQGYILPELYSEEYVDAPYDVSVTATDQLATLKAITYQRGDVNVSLSTIIEDILSFTQISVPVTYHQNLSALRKGEVPMLVDSHISQAAYNGYSCYDVLTNILLSCNCCIMQINGEWLITSLTNSTTNYYTAGVTQVREHKALGQLGVGEVCPAGTLTMVNNPALKGAKVEYAHMLRHSFLANADCVDREGWNYTPDSRNPIDIPGEREAFGKIFKTYCWELHPVNIREDNSLQLWQEVALEKDERNYYDLSVKTLFSTDAKLLLMAVTYLGSDGVERRLTSEGWIEKWDKSDVNYYIQITGTNKNAGLDAIADIEQYEMSTVQFALPPVDGTMRIGFINSTTDYKDPLGAAPIYVSQVYLTVSGVTGQECTTEVEPNATQEQQGVLLAYGDTFESENAYKLGLNTLKKSSGENITSWWLDNENFSSYYDTMLQEFSRYFGVKKAQLQGIIMGKDVLSDMYADVFSGRVMRLLTAQVDLLADEASVTVEEVITTTVDFDTVIYATNNTNSFGSSSGGGAGTSGGASSTAGESLLGVQSDGDVYVKDGRALVGQEGRFENLALPVNAPAKRNEARTYIYSSDPSKGAIDIAKIAKWIDEQAEMWVLDAKNGVIKTTYNVVSEQEIISCRRASGSGSGGGGGITEITAQMVVDALGYVPYSSLNPAGYITSAALNGYATETWVSNNYQPKGNYLTSVAWGDVSGKPTTIGGYGITDALPLSGGELTGSLTISVGSDKKIILNNTDIESKFQYISFRQNGTEYGLLGTSGTDDLVWGKEGTAKILIHSGNIGSQRVANADTLDDYDSSVFMRFNREEGTDLDSLPTNFPRIVEVVSATNTPTSNMWHQVMNWGSADAGYGCQLVNKYTDRTSPLYYRIKSVNFWGDWYQLARTIDNVASATKLQTARSIWGQSFDGTSDVDGNIAINSDAVLERKSSAIWLNYGPANKNENLYLFGYNTQFYYGTASGYRLAMDIKPTGNILMGTTTDRGHKFTVAQTKAAGTITATNLHNTSVLIGDVDDYGYGMNFWTESSGIGYIQQGRTNGSGELFALSLQPFGGNVLIGTTTELKTHKLQIRSAAGGSIYVSSDYDDGAGIVINQEKTSESLNAIRFATGGVAWGAIHGFDRKFGGYAHTLRNINIQADIITLGTWTSPALVVKQSTGNVLIGTTSDSGHKLRVDGGNVCISEVADVRVFLSTMTTTPGVNTHNSFRMGRFNENTGGFKMQFGGTDCNLQIIDYNWKVALFTLSSSGNLIATGEVISSRRATSSDARLKDNINRLIAEDCLAMVRNLQPSSWDWKENGEHSMGFIAQDVEQYMPYAVTKIKDEELGMRLNLQYDQFFAPVVGAIQCLDIKVNGHEDEIESLKNEVEELKQRLSKYETVWQ